MHLITWHCGNGQCGSGTFGQNLYLLDSSTPPLWESLPTSPEAQNRRDWDVFMRMHSVLKLPLTPGADGRDVACTAANLCMVTINNDGFVLYDVGSYDSAEVHKAPVEVGRHSSAFMQEGITAAGKRFTGAQKVYASRVRADRFYVEQSRVVEDRVVFDRLWLAQLAVPYDFGYPLHTLGAGGNSLSKGQVSLADPIVLMTLSISQNLGVVVNLLGKPQPGGKMTGLEKLQRTIQYGLAAAVRIPLGFRRFPITSVYEEDNQRLRVNLEILPDKYAPSPLTILNMLVRQKKMTKSSLSMGRFSSWEGSSLPEIQDFFVASTWPNRSTVRLSSAPIISPDCVSPDF